MEQDQPLDLSTSRNFNTTTPTSQVGREDKSVFPTSAMQNEPLDLSKSNRKRESGNKVSLLF